MGDEGQEFAFIMLRELINFLCTADRSPQWPCIYQATFCTFVVTVVYYTILITLSFLVTIKTTYFTDNQTYGLAYSFLN